ncbi:MAG: glycosyltransferase, partial [Eubacteriales bacterium]
MSNVLLEAFASARPAIATDRAGCREIVDDGVNGYLCRERDTESLIAALEAFLALTDAQRARMGKNARRKAQQQFDRETVVSRYLEEIRLATDTHPAHTPSPEKDGAIQTAPPKITFVTGCMVRGGAERILSVLANHYARAGFTVDILQLLKNRSDYPLEASVRVLDFSDGGSRLAFLKWRGRIRRYLRDEHPLAVVSFMARINAAVGLICRKGKGYRLVMSERNDPICDKRGFFINLLLRRAYRRCDEVVFQTAYARSFAGRFCAGGGRIIPNPIQIDKQLLNEPLRTPNAAKRILSAGRFKAQKNQKLLIEAFRLFHEKCPDYTLTIYGFGELKESLERQIVRAGLSDCVFLLPDTPRLHEEMRNADIFALSSDYEGLSNALLEAMCLGLAVVSTDCSGISEYIENGVNGLLVPVGDAAAFAACLTQLAQEDGLRQTLAQNAVKIRRRVSAEAVFAQWDEVILGSARQETDKKNTAAAFENRTESEEARR